MTKAVGSERFPVLFIGHGSPMNAIADNDFTQTLSRLGVRVGRPRAVLCISAHWMTRGVWVTAMTKPKTIHDFRGFPQPLFDVQYPAPGEPELAATIGEALKASLDVSEWGLDHGTWSVLRHLYPAADVPVLQLSLNLNEPAPYHYQLARALRALRDQGVLIVGSGNIVHNLRQIQWATDAQPFKWAVEFDGWVRECLVKRDFLSLVNSYAATEAGRLSVPTPEHYYPLLYCLGAAFDDETVRFEYEGMQNASISMRSFSLSR